MTRPTLTISVSGDASRIAPWTFGQPCKRGDFPDSLALLGQGVQVDVKSRWEDGSVKHALISGITLPGTYEIVPATYEPSADVVTMPDLSWLTVVVAGDGGGTYGIPAGLVPTEVSYGVLMTEAVFVVPTFDEHLTIRWTIRAYRNGAVEVETMFENGFLNKPGVRHRTYSAAVHLGDRVESVGDIGTSFWKTPVRKSDTVFRFPAYSADKNFPAGCWVRFGADEPALRVAASRFVSGGTEVEVEGVLPADVSRVFILGHPAHTRWSRVDWFREDREVLPKHDGTYLMQTGLVPNFYMGDGGVPDGTRLSKLSLPLAPFARGAYPVSMGASGSNSEPLRNEACFYVKCGDARAWRSMIAHAHAAGRYGIFYRDETTGEAPLYDSYPKHGYSVSAGFSSTKYATGTLRFPVGGLPAPRYAKSHAPQLSYLAYLLTGRPSFRDTVEFQAQVGHWCCNSAAAKVDGVRVPVAALSAFSPRGAAWCIRAIGEACVVLPDGHPRRWQYERQLEKTLLYYARNFLDKNQMGAVQPSNGYTAHGWDSKVSRNFTGQAAFQDNYFSIAVAQAYLAAGHLLSDPACGDFVRWRLRMPVLRTGTAESGYPFEDAVSVYAPKLAVPAVHGSEKPTADFNAAVFPTMRDAYIATYGRAPEEAPADNRLRGRSGSNPGELAKVVSNEWAIHMAALAYAVDLGVDGAREAWARLTGASNFNPTGFRNYPDFGIYPR